MSGRLSSWRDEATVADLVNNFLACHRLTGRELARWLGRPGAAGEVTVSRWRHGARTPSVGVVRATLEGIEARLLGRGERP